MSPTEDPPMRSGPIKNGDYEVKDTGRRKVFETGAQRDALGGKGYFHSIPYVAIEGLAKIFEAGALKYDKDNWKKGIPLSCYLDSAHRHLFKLSEGWRDEDHASMTLWNVSCFMWTVEAIKDGRLPKSLDDVGWIQETDQAK